MSILKEIGPSKIISWASDLLHVIIFSLSFCNSIAHSLGPTKLPSVHPIIYTQKTFHCLHNLHYQAGAKHSIHQDPFWPAGLVCVCMYVCVCVCVCVCVSAGVWPFRSNCFDPLSSSSEVRKWPAGSVWMCVQFLPLTDVCVCVYFKHRRGQ